MLKRLRAKERTWIDAYEINQDDIPRKNFQIKSMDKIYANATSVIVLFDEADMIILKNIIEILSKTFNKNDINDFYNSCAQNFEGSNICYIQLETAIEKILDLVKTSMYFRRVWTFQELMLSKNVEWYNEDGENLSNLKSLAETYIEEIVSFLSKPSKRLDNSSRTRDIRDKSIRFSAYLIMLLGLRSKYRNHCLFNPETMYNIDHEYMSTLDLTLYDLLLGNRECLKKHDLVYGYYRLLNLEVEVDYNKEFDVLLGEFNAEIIRQSILPLAHANSNDRSWYAITVEADRNAWIKTETPAGPRLTTYTPTKRKTDMKIGDDNYKIIRSVMTPISFNIDSNGAINTEGNVSNIMKIIDIKECYLATDRGREECNFITLKINSSNKIESENLKIIISVNKNLNVNIEICLILLQQDNYIVSDIKCRTILSRVFPESNEAIKECKDIKYTKMLCKFY